MPGDLQFYKSASGIHERFYLPRNGSQWQADSTGFPRRIGGMASIPSVLIAGKLNWQRSMCFVAFGSGLARAVSQSVGQSGLIKKWRLNGGEREGGIMMGSPDIFVELRPGRSNRIDAVSC